jgi:conjugative relaxase-like TrwC/TraI family protein
MLSVAKLTLGQEAYYEQQVVRGLDDYYAGRGESPGIWTGKGAGGLGLVGVVDDGDLGTLLRGVNPASGSQLREPVRARTITVRALDIESGEWHDEEKRLAPVSGYDLVFSCPKSVSLLHALTDDERVRRAISEAHEKSWQAALVYLEREACVVRRGHGGILREHGGGFVAAAFRHRTSRAQDPHLHTHVIVANMTRTVDGEWRALDGEAILKTYRLAAGYLYEGQLRHELTRRLGVEWTEPVKGMGEIVGVPEQALRAFSSRRQTLVEHMQEHGTEGFAAARVAALATREAKEQVDLPRLRLEWQARAAEYGLGRRELAALASEHPLARRELGREHIAAHLFSADGLTATRTSFSLPELVCAVAGALPDGAPVGRVLEEAEALSRFPGVELVESGEIPGRPVRFTTRELLEIERDALAVALAGQDAGAPSLERGRLAELLMASRSSLSGEQRMLVHEASCRPDRVVCIVGVAGAGKTTALAALADAHRASGIPVLGAAPSGRAADELEATTGMPSRTLHRLLLEARERPLPHGCVLVVDEAGMAETRVLAPLLRLIDEAEGKALLVGDPAQLPAVGAGGLYLALCEQLGAIELAGNRRQRDPLERQALARLRAGDPEPYLAHAARGGRLQIADEPTNAKQRLLDDWWQTAQHDLRGSAMLAYAHADVRELNDAAHMLMLQAGRLGPEAIELGGRQFRVGDRVICRRNYSRLGLRNGTRATVVSLDETMLAIRADSGAARSVPRDYAAEHLEHGYALTGHAAQGATVERAFVLLPDWGALQEWGYVACTRARSETRLYLTEATLDPDAHPCRREPLGAPERTAGALVRTSAEPLALDQSVRHRDVSARLHARQQEQLEQQRVRAAEQLAVAQRELKHLGWWNRGNRRFELQRDIAFQQTALRSLDEKRVELEQTSPKLPRLPAPALDRDELTPARSLRPEPPSRRTLEREPPGLEL